MDKIKEDEKRDRQAICKEKKMKYTLNKMSKEENSRMKLRTEERIILVRGRENLWKNFFLILTTDNDTILILKYLQKPIFLQFQ